MTRDDRDRSIEELLRHSRADQLPAADRCPDVELLAALADNTLVAAEHRVVEAHVADCHACQTVLAAISHAETSAAERTADLPTAVPWWKRPLIVYLVPAAAASIAIALWVAIPGEQTPESVSQKATELQSSPAVTLREERAEQGSLTASERRDATPSAPPAAPAPPPMAASLPPPPPPAALSSDQNAVGRMEDSAATQEFRRQTVEPQAAPSPSGRAIPAPPGAVALAAPNAPPAIEVVAPDGRGRWRIGPGSAIQYSTDAGTTWVTQQSPASTDLVAGVSPAAGVCWLVGRGGTVLRTTDAGSQWQRMTFPETVDLTALTASSAQAATITAADGRQFSTSDGGETWRPLP